YEIVTLRNLGATRAEVLEALAFGAFHGGPRAINAFAEVGDEYLREWLEPDGTTTRVAWPEGWRPETSAFRSGIDLSSDELLARAGGATRREATTSLLWAAVYGADAVMETAFDAAGDVLEGWGGSYYSG